MTQHARIQERIDAWGRATPVLEADRRESIQSASTIEAFKLLAPLVKSAIRETPLRPTSGLVEQQRWFKKLAGQ
ncbi:MAG: hypothetical protein AAGA58_14020 [Verrucomicrobiota bacterium]